MSRKVLDVAIIGGGPAGTAAAIAARSHGLKVAVWDRQTFPRDKVCGEFISAESLSLLERWVPRALQRSSTISRCEFISPGGRVDGFALPQPAIGLSRRRLDAALWQAASDAGAATYEKTGICSVHALSENGRADATWRLETAKGEVIPSRSLILACGRWWSIRGPASPPPRPDGPANAWTGLKAHFAGIAVRDAVEMYYFPGGYFGLAPVEDGLYNVCGLVHRGLLKSAGRAGGIRDFYAWLRRMGRHPALEARLRNAHQSSPTVATAPVRPAPGAGAIGGAFLAGDAAGFIDPFTGDGISIALRSGCLAAEILAGAMREERLPLGRAPLTEYRRRLSEALRRSYRFAGVLRSLVSAPQFLQVAAAGFLPWLGPMLTERTRWRGARSALRNPHSDTEARAGFDAGRPPQKI